MAPSQSIQNKALSVHAVRRRPEDVLFFVSAADEEGLHIPAGAARQLLVGGEKQAAAADRALRRPRDQGAGARAETSSDGRSPI